jgi:DNA-binding LacI/PurR family transcriptional regulator
VKRRAQPQQDAELERLARHVNMADVARAAGVSMATTSRALNNQPGVAPATRARVLEAARQHAYVVSPAASTLSGGATRRIAVVVPHLSRWFFGEMLEGIEQTLREAGYDLMLYRVGEGADRDSFFELLPARRKVDGVLVVGIPATAAEQARLATMGVRIVAAGGQVTPYPFVSIDDHGAGQQAVNHLVHLGHRRVAMIDAIDPNASQWPVDGRALAYDEARRSRGLDSDPGLFQRVPWSARHGAEAMAALLALERPPTAVLAHSDELAIGALHTIRRAGLDVPGDISVIGIDDHPLSAEADLTTVRQEVHEQGRLAARILLDGLAGRETASSTVLPTKLIIRGTTGRPPSARA